MKVEVDLPQQKIAYCKAVRLSDWHSPETSAPVASHTADMELMLEIRWARKALAANYNLSIFNCNAFLGGKASVCRQFTTRFVPRQFISDSHVCI